MLDTIRTLYNFFLSFDVEIVAKTSQRWLRMFTDLVERGLKYPLIVVSDDIGGITEVIKTIFPKANQQICLVHLRWNARCYMSCEDYKDFKNAISQIKLCSDFESAKEQFLELCNKYEVKYKYFIKHIKEKADNYLQFVKYEEPIYPYKLHIWK